MNLKLSIGTAAALGLAHLKTDALPTTAYLMDPGGRCSYNCSFCAQARCAQSDDSKLSRVIWREYPIDVVMEGLKKAVASGQIKRTCVQVTLSPGSFERTLTIVKAVSSTVDVPMSVSTNIQNEEQVHALFEAGAARVSIALDAATEPLHQEIKNSMWHFKIDLLKRMAQRYPGGITTHFIVGLGESEKEVLTAIDDMYASKVTVGLFAFTPVKGTAMADVPPPSAGQYRRVQLANWLLKTHQVSLDQLIFNDEGQLVKIDADTDKLLSLAQKGVAFQTAGCVNCNRPFYNENPGHGVMYNYPRPLRPTEAKRALLETELFDDIQVEALYQ